MLGLLLRPRAPGSGVSEEAHLLLGVCPLYLLKGVLCPYIFLNSFFKFEVSNDFFF